MNNIAARAAFTNAFAGVAYAKGGYNLYPPLWRAADRVARALYRKMAMRLSEDVDLAIGLLRSHSAKAGFGDGAR